MIGVALIEIKNQAIVFFMYAGMMLVVLVIFIFLARNYQYVEFTEVEDVKEETKK